MVVYLVSENVVILVLDEVKTEVPSLTESKQPNDDACTSYQPFKRIKTDHEHYDGDTSTSCKTNNEKTSTSQVITPTKSTSLNDSTHILDEPSTSGKITNNKSKKSAKAKSQNYSVHESGKSKSKSKPKSKDSSKKVKSRGKKTVADFSDEDNGGTLDISKRGLPDYVDTFGKFEHDRIVDHCLFPSHTNMQVLILHEVALEGRLGITLQGIRV